MEGFVMVWDDLTSPPMRRAFDKIAKEMKDMFGPARVRASIELFNGWVGEMVRPHPIGIVRCAQ
jgi:hypothetical protein